MHDPIAELERAVAAYAEAAEVAARRRVERDAVIATAFKAGVPIRVIASTVGLTAARVSDLLGRPMRRPGRPRGRPAGSVVHVYPDPAPEGVHAAWCDAVEDAGLSLDEVALIWRGGRPRPTGQEAASWRAGSEIDPEFDDDEELLFALDWANSASIRGRRRVMVWVDRTPEGLAGLLRHELEHTVQLAYHVELDHLHRRALEEVQKRGGTGKSYNAIPMEVDANRAAARFLRHRYGADRLSQLIEDGDRDSACFRPTADPGRLDTLTERMMEFIGRTMREDDFVFDLESGSPAV